MNRVLARFIVRTPSLNQTKTYFFQLSKASLNTGDTLAQ